MDVNEDVNCSSLLAAIEYRYSEENDCAINAIK